MENPDFFCELIGFWFNLEKNQFSNKAVLVLWITFARVAFFIRWIVLRGLRVVEDAHVALNQDELFNRCHAQWITKLWMDECHCGEVAVRCSTGRCHREQLDCYGMQIWPLDTIRQPVLQWSLRFFRQHRNSEWVRTLSMPRQDNEVSQLGVQWHPGRSKKRRIMSQSESGGKARKPYKCKRRGISEHNQQIRLHAAFIDVRLPRWIIVTQGYGLRWI